MPGVRGVEIQGGATGTIITGDGNRVSLPRGEDLRPLFYTGTKREDAVGGETAPHNPPMPPSPATKGDLEIRKDWG